MGAEVSYPSNSVLLAAANVQTIGRSKSVMDGTEMSLQGKTFTVVFPGPFYVEEPDRASGIRIGVGTFVTEGDLVSVTGQMGTTEDEQEIVAPSATLTPMSELLPPLGLGTLSSEARASACSPASRN